MTNNQAITVLSMIEAHEGLAQRAKDKAIEALRSQDKSFTRKQLVRYMRKIRIMGRAMASPEEDRAIQEVISILEEG